MIQLTSKIQYKDFEIGEFTEEKKRSFDEVAELIEQFPWETQRENIVIDLTNPSITVQGKNNDYLKLALFYNGKFVLHYFDQGQALYTKSFLEIEQSYQFIKRYFESPIFDPGDFKKENTIFQNNLKHFFSQSFHYTVTPKSARKFLFSTSGINLILTVFIIASAPFIKNIELTVLSILIIFMLVFLLGGGINLILFFQYYLYAKNKILTMSKGNEIFYFGDKENPIKYNKTQILRYTTIRIRNSKHTISNFALVIIVLKNGGEIRVPNILLDYTLLECKLSGISRIEQNSYPGLKV